MSDRLIVWISASSITYLALYFASSYVPWPVAASLVFIGLIVLILVASLLLNLTSRRK